jgi:hypothetical protein
VSWVASTCGIEASNIRDLMVQSVEHRFGVVNRLPGPIQ